MNKVIILLGPTAVGKSGAAVLLAKELHTGIISADSMQVYRHMDIGTAKPPPAELAQVPHHLINIVEPREEFSAGRFLELAVPIIERLHSEGKIPVIAGGTGLYIRAMTRGLFPGPSADRELRGELLEQEAASPGCLHSLLKEIDPESAAGLSEGDARRIVRALEVSYKSDGKAASGLKKALTAPLPYEFIKIGITRDRKELYSLIEKRVDEMLADGFLQEVQRVLSMGPSQTAMQAIGYKELSGCLRGECNLEEAIRLVKRNTRRYAKRQFTWFKKEEGVTWVDVTGIYYPGGIYRKLKEGCGAVLKSHDG